MGLIEPADKICLHIIIFLTNGAGAEMVLDPAVTFDMAHAFLEEHGHLKGANPATGAKMILYKAVIAGIAERRDAQPPIVHARSPLIVPKGAH